MAHGESTAERDELVELARAMTELDLAERAARGHRAYEPGEEEPPAVFDILYERARARLSIPARTVRDTESVAFEWAEQAATRDELEDARSLLGLFYNSGTDLMGSFMRERYLPNYNRLGRGMLRCCPGCYQTFAPTDPRNLYCSTSCGDRIRQARLREAAGPASDIPKGGDALSSGHVSLDAHQGWAPEAVQEFHPGDDDARAIVSTLAKRDGPGAIIEALAEHMEADGELRSGRLLRGVGRDLQKIAQ